MHNFTEPFIPWEQYPSLELDRLKQLASEIKTARDSVVALHDAEAGDNNWSKHCHGYVRQNHAVRALASSAQWLEVSSHNPNDLELSIRVGEVPLKIVRGDPEHPIYRHKGFSAGEQLLMGPIMGQLPPNPLRLIASTDEAGSVTAVHLVEFDGPLPSNPIPSRWTMREASSFPRPTSRAHVR